MGSASTVREAMTTIGRSMNFTHEIHASSYRKVGTIPLQYPANASGKWGGLFGKVFSGEYQVTSLIWNNR